MHPLRLCAAPGDRRVTSQVSRLRSPLQSYYCPITAKTIAIAVCKVLAVIKIVGMTAVMLAGGVAIYVGGKRRARRAARPVAAMGA
jgi:hypothetical protein